MYQQKGDNPTKRLKRETMKTFKLTLKSNKLTYAIPFIGFNDVKLLTTKVIAGYKIPREALSAGYTTEIVEY